MILEGSVDIFDFVFHFVFCFDEVLVVDIVEYLGDFEFIAH